MTPWRPTVTIKYPLLIAGRVRAYADWRRLELSQRSRIKASRHSRSMGYFFRPTSLADEWAVQWIEVRAVRYGVLRWKNGKWIREKFVAASKEV